jgi:hypothetical protein
MKSEIGQDTRLQKLTWQQRLTAAIAKVEGYRTNPIIISVPWR